MTEDPEVPEAVKQAVARAMELMLLARDGTPDSVRAAIEELEVLSRAQSGDAKMLVENARIMLTLVRASTDGDESALRRVTADVRALQGMAAAHPAAGPMVEQLAATVDYLASMRRGGDVSTSMADFRTRMERLGDVDGPDGLAPGLLTMMDPREAVSRGRTGVPPSPPTAAQIAAIEGLSRQPGPGYDQLAFQQAMLGAVAIGGGQHTDLRQVEAGVAHMRAALAVVGADHPQRAYFQYWLSAGLVHRYELTGNAEDLADAGRALEDARNLAGGPHHQLWSDIHELLAHVRRRRSAPEARKIALAALPANLWRVMSQADLTAARDAARDAAATAIGIARQCILDNDPADAIQALDAGRGLALFAAAGLRDAAVHLDAAGERALATRWRQAKASGQPPHHLRQEVLTALSDTTSILRETGIGEIRHALRTLDADALVYLVPADDSSPGWAVIAPVAGPPAYMDLPDLTAAEGRDVDRFVSGLRSRDLFGEAEDELTADLDTLCDWAWNAAVGPLIDKVLPILPPPATDRPYHLVLVPMGELALVPWAAARRPDGVYAIQLAAFSQAASARMLIDSAAWAPVRRTGVGLVVGNPNTGRPRDDLGAAGVEAYAIHQTFYRGGRYVGRRADRSASTTGHGTAEEVRDWLKSTRPGAGDVLHLACHGVIDTDADEATSFLLLAGGSRLTAAELVDLMAENPARAVGLVVLAACRTGRSTHGYDEAYSLGTALLAGGARSVLSTQWSIPDSATSGLMFMFHHYLASDRRPIWAALRQAQLWMLDPRREIPPDMPSQLRQQFSGVDLTQVAAWAGFVHWGH